jgi:hypothetical protein
MEDFACLCITADVGDDPISCRFGWTGGRIPLTLRPACAAVMILRFGEALDCRE